VKGVSSADKTGGHTVHAVSSQGGLGAKLKRSVPAYTQVNPPVAPPATGVSQAGQKGLALRAKKILGPLEDPTQSIAE
jgi:hypothetical protein